MLRIAVLVDEFPDQPGHQHGRRLSIAKLAVARSRIAISIAWMRLLRRRPLPAQSGGVIDPGADVVRDAYEAVSSTGKIMNLRM